MKFENKVVVVTGGSRGIGYAIAEKFLQEGATVVVAASSQANADKAAAKLKEAYPSATVSGICPSLPCYESVKAAMDSVVATYGKIDVLINNAGVSEATPFTSYTEEVYDKVMDLNVKGVYNATRAVVDQMIAQKSGSIVNLSSMVSLYGQTSGFAYPTSKFAINGMTLSLARELAPKGIRVNAVAPGVTETDMVKALPEQVVQYLVSTTPLGRIGKPEDVANAVAFLASDDASFISGQVLHVDGLART